MLCRAAASRRNSARRGSTKRPCGRRSRRPGPIDPEERRHLDGYRRRHRKTEDDDGIRSGRVVAPRNRGDTTSCFQRRSEARANSRERASRLPMRFTATRNASSVASPASTRTAYLLAQVVLQPLRRRSGSPAGGAEVAIGRSAASSDTAPFIRHRQTPVAEARRRRVAGREEGRAPARCP